MPLYSARIEWDPTVSQLVLKSATPPLRAFDPRVAPPSLNVTIPVGVPPNAELPVAVKVTHWPYTDRSGEEVRIVSVERRVKYLTITMPEPPSPPVC